MTNQPLSAHIFMYHLNCQSIGSSAGFHVFSYPPWKNKICFVVGPSSYEMCAWVLSLCAVHEKSFLSLKLILHGEKSFLKCWTSTYNSWYCFCLSIKTWDTMLLFWYWWFKVLFNDEFQAFHVIRIKTKHSFQYTTTSWIMFPLLHVSKDEINSRSL